MNFIVDLSLILILLIGLALGIKRGFIKTVAKPVKFILTLVIAFSFAAPVSEALVEPRVREPISNQMEEYILENCEGINKENIKEELPTVLKIGASLFDIDIDSLDIDFSKYNMHLPPNVSDDEYHFYFHDVCGGVNEWIMGTINRPESKDITHDAVSALMEFKAEILWWREDELWYEH